MLGKGSIGREVDVNCGEGAEGDSDDDGGVVVENDGDTVGDTMGDVSELVEDCIARCSNDGLNGG